MWLIDWITNVCFPAKAHQKEQNEVGENNNEDKIEDNDKKAAEETTRQKTDAENTVIASANIATGTNIDNKKNLFSLDIENIEEVNDDHRDSDDDELLNALKNLESKNKTTQCDLNSNQTLDLTI